MKKFASLIALAATLGTPAWAATKTITLSVPGMTCTACPITIKKALSKIAGIQKTEINLEKRETVITFDDAEVNAKTLMRATANAGYPSTVKE